LAAKSAGNPDDLDGSHWMTVFLGETFQCFSSFTRWSRSRPIWVTGLNKKGLEDAYFALRGEKPPVPLQEATGYIFGSS